MDHIVKLAAPAPAQMPVTIRGSGLSKLEKARRRVAPVLGTVCFETGDLR